MRVTLLGIVTDVIPLQLQKVLLPISVIDSGITKFVISVSFKYKCLALLRGLDSEPLNVILHQAVRSVIFTLVSPLQPSNAYAAICVILTGIETEVKPLQYRKASLPIFVTPSGIFIEVKLLHHSKAPFSMLVTLLGIVTEVKPLHLLKASTSMNVTLLGIVTEVKLVQS